MFIENPEAFKSWLTSILEPLCDADPAALAKYVYALVKKEKPPDELKEGMLDQLDVFLQHETKPFVDLLFKTLEKQEYVGEVGGVSGDGPIVGAGTTVVPPPVVPMPSAPVNASVAVASQKPLRVGIVTSQDNSLILKVPTSTTAAKQNNRVVLSRSNATNSSIPSTNGSSGTIVTVTSVTTTAITSTTSAAPRTARQHNYMTEQTLVKVVPDFLEQATAETAANQTRLKRDRDRRRRSRSRSWERVSGGRRERPLGREGGERDRGPVPVRRTWRNRSPPSANTGHSMDYRRRGGSRSPSPLRVNPTTTGGRYRNRSPPGATASGGARGSRSRSRTPPRHVRRGEQRDVRDSHRRSRDRVSPQDCDSRDSPPGPMVSRKRCRDFDEKGYCMRGDLCSWDHGVDPVVVEDAALSSVLALGEYNPLTPDIWRETPSATVYPQPASAAVPAAPLPAAAVPPTIPTNLPPPPHHHHLYPMTGGYHRMLVANSSVQYGATPPVVPPLPSHNGLGVAGVVGGRSLVEIPRAASPPPPKESLHQSHPHQGHMYSQPGINNNSFPVPRWKRRGAFDYNRPTAPKPPVNSSLVLRRVPPGLNDITHLNNHFSKFGKIVNMQVNFENDPESALVTFTSHAEANTAYKSTEAVLNNRFIRVFWHNTNTDEKNDVPGPAGTAPEPKDGAPGEGTSDSKVANKLSVTSGMFAPTTTTSTVSTFTSLNNTHNKVLVNKENIGRTAAAAAIASGAGAANKRRLAATVRARGQQLLHRQLQHQRLLIQRLESDKVTGEPRERLLSAVKAAQDGIEKLRKELMSTNNTVATPAQPQLAQKTSTAAKVKSREETQRELLDAELDLFNKQHEGSEDIVEIQHRMVELRRLQQQTEQQHRRRFGRPGGRGGLPGVGMGRGALAAVGKCVDRRPRTFLVTGLTAEESQHLSNLLTPLGALTTTTGGMESNSSGTGATNLVASFARRVSAELSLNRIKTMYPNANVTWLQQQDNTAKKSIKEPKAGGPSVINPAGPSDNATTNGAVASHSNSIGDVHLKTGEDEDVPEVTAEDEEALLMGPITLPSHVTGDEEEEEPEEEEERSWRR